MLIQATLALNDAVHTLAAAVVFEDHGPGLGSSVLANQPVGAPQRIRSCAVSRPRTARCAAQSYGRW